MTPEASIKAQISHALRQLGWYGRPMIMGRIPGRTNPMKGIPDQLWIKDGRVVFIEVKAPGGVLSEEQKDFIREWTRYGGEVHVVYSLKDCLRGLGYVVDKTPSVSK